ncbi:MAG: hypothetical protein QM770_04935 [Tepidisphaeraceae bacterium]
MFIAVALQLLVLAYLAVGVPFAVWFAWRGAGEIDPVAVHGSLGFRLLILSGSAALWLLLLITVRRQRKAVMP